MLTVPTEYYNDRNRYSDLGLFWALSCDWSSLKVPMIPPRSSLRPTNNDRSLMSNTTEVIVNLELQWASPRNNVDIYISSWYFYFLDCTHHSTYATLGSLRIDDFCTTPPLDCVTCSLRMPFWALASVAPKATTLVRAIRRRLGNGKTWG